MRLRNLVRVGVLECRSSFDLISVNCIIFGYKFGFYISRGIGLIFLEERVDFCCKVVVELGLLVGIMLDDKVDGYDGFVLIGDGSEL